MRAALLLLFVVLPGVAVIVVCGYFLVQDWAALNSSFARWEHLVAASGTARALMAADTYQNAFRINCFADGVGLLLGGILTAIGVVGLCLLGRAK